MNHAISQTLGEIVAADYRAAVVLERFGLDFCCGGKRTLDEACDERALNVTTVLEALNGLQTNPADEATPTLDWPLDRLIDYIVARHHAYVRRALPTIQAHARKIAEVHGLRNPNLPRLVQYVDDLAQELTTHMDREEAILFPYIASLAAAERAGRRIDPSPFGTVHNPIRCMEADHAHAGEDLRLMRELTNDYALPDFACATYRACFEELREFERDLHLHIHLENNILHPTAIAIEERLS